MHSLIRHGNQAGISHRASSHIDQLNLIWVCEEISNIEEELYNEGPAKAREDLNKLHGGILDAMRNAAADHRSLSGVDLPVFKIDAALHAMRKHLLDSKFRNEGWKFEWDGDAVAVNDPDRSAFIEIDPCDNWWSSTGTPDSIVTGYGLTTFIAWMQGQPMCQTAGGLAKWLREREART